MTRFAEITRKIIEMLENDDEMLVKVVKELDDWNGYLDEDRLFYMWELDDHWCNCKVSDFVDKLGDFNSRDEFFYYHLGNINSFDGDEAEWYRDRVDIGDVFDSLVAYQNHLWLDDELKNLLEERESAIDED